MTTAAKALREQQEADPKLGRFFAALHTFAERTLDEYFYDWPGMPHPIIVCRKLPNGTRGHYQIRDEYGLDHVIVLNVFAIRTGAEAAEVLAHELVHMWQVFIGKPTKHNYHNEEFHSRMAELGIITEGRLGKFVKTTGEWEAWLVVNEDLKLDGFLLPGSQPKPHKRKMLKHVCPGCGANFRSRKPIAAKCVPCNKEFRCEGNS